MGDREDDPKRAQIDGKEITVSSEAEVSCDSVSTGTLEYGDIRNEADLMQHLLVPTARYRSRRLEDTYDGARIGSRKRLNT